MGLFDIFTEDTLLFALRLMVALVLSGLIGFEREIKNHSAGFRTHILVGVGACLMMLLSLYGFEEFMESHENVRFDPARIPSYVISGIGFLGAGTIIVNGMTIRGLTTAASIWTVAGIGLVVGAGMYDIAIITTFIVLLSLIFLNKIERRKFQAFKKYGFHLTVQPQIDLTDIMSVFTEANLTIEKINIKIKNHAYKGVFIELEKSQTYDHFQVVDDLSRIEGVVEVNHNY